MPRAFFCAALVVGSLLTAVGDAQDHDVQHGDASGQDWAFAAWRENVAPVEEFLRQGDVTGRARVPIGITRPMRLTLTEGDVEADAIFKTVDIYEQKMQFEDGSFELNFRDSYKNELAAYILDRWLETELVPPTVVRRIDGTEGAVRLWIVGAMSEVERRDRDIQAPDPAAWSRQVANVRLFLSLTGNSDYNNINNLLIDQDFRIVAIDHSRAFRTRRDLVGETLLVRFSREMLERLEALDERSLAERLDPWVSKAQIKALLKRRDKILKRVDKLVELKGEDQVLFD